MFRENVMLVCAGAPPGGASPSTVRVSPPCVAGLAPSPRRRPWGRPPPLFRRVGVVRGEGGEPWDDRSASSQLCVLVVPDWAVGKEVFPVTWIGLGC